MGTYEEDIAARKAGEAERRRFITEARMGTDAVSTVKIQEEAVSELTFYQNLTDVPFTGSYGSSQIIEEVFFTGTGSPIIIHVEEQYTLSGLSLTLVNHVKLDIETKIIANGIVEESILLRVLDIQLSGGNPLTLAATQYQATFFLDTIEGTIYTVEVSAIRDRVSGSDVLDNVTSSQRTVIFQTLKR